MFNAITKALTIAVMAGSLAVPIAANAAVPGVTQMHGTITAFNGKYDIHVQDRRGEVNDVTLHAGTIINPTGLTLKPGMRVTILGSPTGQTFNADEIDTPYHIDRYEPLASSWRSRYFGGPYADGPYFEDSYFNGPFSGPHFGWF